MKVTLSKVTIVAERLLKERLIAMIRDEGATGYTLTAVEGEGSRGIRASDWEGRNIQIETIVSLKSADAIIERLSEDYFEHFAVIAWVGEVSVLRGSKFAELDEKD